MDGSSTAGDRKALLVAQCELSRVEMALSLQDAKLALSPPRVEAGSTKRNIAAFVIAFAAPFFGASRMNRFMRGASIVFTLLRFFRPWRQRPR
jgi:hypothetical protein